MSATSHSTHHTCSGERALIVGMGKTGVSCARFLAARGVCLRVADSRAHPPGLDSLQRLVPAADLHLGPFDDALLADTDCLIVSPGVSLREPIVAQALRGGMDVIGDIELFARHVHAPVVAVTGTNGKSTVTTLVAEMAGRAGRHIRVGGNLGTPALDLLPEPDAGAAQSPIDMYILELSSFQLETTGSLNPVAAVVLNVSPDHMDRYASVAEYAEAKRRIYRGDGVMVINADDPIVRAMARDDRRVIRFGLGEPAAGDFGLREHKGAAWLAKGEHRLMPATDLRIPGRHNMANALAALALGDAVGIAEAPMLEALRDFAGLPHRMQWVAERRGVTWYNDSKGTNVGATVASLAGMPGPLVLIAGGDGKGADFAPLAAAAAGKVHTAVLLGRDGAALGAALPEGVAKEYARDMAEAVSCAAAAAQSGDQVVLSPACASFDMFDNFEHRGEVFVAAVRGLPS